MIWCEEKKKHDYGEKKIVNHNFSASSLLFAHNLVILPKKLCHVYSKVASAIAFKEDRFANVGHLPRMPL